MKVSWVVVVAVAVAPACKKDSSTTPGRGGSADPGKVAAVDALWRLAPKAANLGGVVSGKALVLVDRAIALTHELAEAVPGGDGLVDQIDELRRVLLGTAATYADAGLALDRGAAIFASSTAGRTDRFVAVLPVADRGKFVATHGGSHDGELDHVAGLVCKPIGEAYACAANPADLVLGGGDLGSRAGIRGVRGDAEAVIAAPPMPPDAPLAPTGPIRVVIGIDPGTIVLRAFAPATLRGPLAALAAAKPAHLAIDTAAGFAIVPIDALAGALPLDVVPAPLRDLLRNVAGPLTAIAPAGVADVDFRLPLTSADAGRQFLDHCDELSSPPAPIVKAADTCAIGPIPMMGTQGTVWLDGTTLRISRDRGEIAAGSDRGGPTAIGRELAGYTVAFWGHGWSPPDATAALPPAARALGTSLGSLSELGLGARFAADGIDVVLAARTIHANPDTVLAEIQRALASGDTANVAAIAKAHRDAPFAADIDAGPTGLKLPTMLVGVVAGVAIPAFLEYMKKGRGSEPEIWLGRMTKSAKAYWIQNGKFPTGDSGLTPATSSCDEPHHMFPRSSPVWTGNPVWSALDFAVEDAFRFQYRYQGSAKEFTATAVADLDCDGAGVTTITAHGTIDASGNPVVDFQKSGDD